MKTLYPVQDFALKMSFFKSVSVNQFSTLQLFATH